MYQAAITYAQLRHLHLPFQLPDVLQKIGDRAFVVAAASVWNKLPQ